MKTYVVLISVLLSTTTTQAGYGEINSVGDKRAVYHMKEIKSTKTDSKVVEVLSNSEKYYVLSNK